MEEDIMTYELTDHERRITWNCRRGLKELDVFLSPFMEEHYRGLSDHDKAVFERLLTCEDIDLFHWFLGDESTPDPELERMIGLIRSRVATCS
ncbi:MAG: succinate dehydrogenase assembly factor 2 [Moraxellaceae bacterium]|jgi:antitoxin CptB|nr:succinate dehydrogenase assembly factor 2 [Moraxellaceae bacterium]MBP7230255.1 succinate dehydrogenase assembly factor 2 [Moraxellaceae bacterium]MBP8852110.1 succinate dehydrogenase assembly factor 2 [Moraxellaceae bacterium]MBP9045069.1 succinate dehydrogenase assembly factor 2 [Moraxellaceae bacterium]MBP9731392.1 succinate dehydrogenase assembly factor 2 [Moraxellaceae bacterium]